MDNSAIMLERMNRQGLTGGRFSDPASLVGWMGCVQAQDFGMAKWGVGLRVSPDVSDAVIDAAFNAGTILRTHVLRPTWHFVLPADIGWMLRLSAPRIRGFCRPYHSRLAIDEAVLRKSRRVFSGALRDGVFMTRAELAALLKRAKIDVSDIRMNFLLIDAELSGLICSGPRRGKQFTYGSLENRVVRPTELAGDEALGELARRYFLSRGPATVHDFAWWSGMTVGNAKRGMEVAQVERLPSSPGRTTPQQVFLLPAFDELTVGYRDRYAILPKEYEKASAYGLKPAIVVDGRIAGIWRKDPVELNFFEKVSKKVVQLAEKEIKRYERFQK